MTDPKAKAQKIRNRYSGIICPQLSSTPAAPRSVLCAISEVQAKIALLNKIIKADLSNDFKILMRRGEYIEILQELKNMNQ